MKRQARNYHILFSLSRSHSISVVASLCDTRCDASSLSLRASVDSNCRQTDFPDSDPVQCARSICRSQPPTDPQPWPWPQQPNETTKKICEKKFREFSSSCFTFHTSNAARVFRVQTANSQRRISSQPKIIATRCHQEFSSRVLSTFPNQKLSSFACLK